MAETATKRSTIEALGSFYSRGILVLAAGSTAAIVLIMGVQVFYRYVLNNSLIWAEEICRHLLIWITFLFAGPALHHGQMISIQFLMKKLTKPVMIGLFVISHAMLMVFIVSLVYFGYQYARLNSLQVIPALNFIWSDLTGNTTDINVSMFWVYLSVPVGLVVFLGHLIMDFLAQLSGMLRKSR